MAVEITGKELNPPVLQLSVSEDGHVRMDCNKASLTDHLQALGVMLFYAASVYRKQYKTETHAEAVHLVMARACNIESTVQDRATMQMSFEQVSTEDKEEVNDAGNESV